jgi:hypothetical protein
LTRSAAAWALRRAVRLAIGTCIVALILATTLSGDAAERFATTAYLAVIFSAIALIVQRFVPEPAAESRTVPPAPFPTFLTYSIGIVVLVSVVAALVSQPGAEALTIALCLAAVGAAVLARSGTLAALNAALLRGGGLLGASRYAAFLAVLAIPFAAFAGGDVAEILAQVVYRLMLFAAVCILASLLLPSSTGDSVRAIWLRVTALQDRGTLVAAAVAVGAMICASVVPAPFSEPFAVAAYAAALCAAAGVAIECRRLQD